MSTNHDQLLVAECRESTLSRAVPSAQAQTLGHDGDRLDTDALGCGLISAAPRSRLLLTSRLLTGAFWLQ